MPKSSQRSAQLRVITLGIVICLVAGSLLRVIGLETKIFWIDEVFTGVRIAGFTTIEVSADLTAKSQLTAASLDQFQYPNPEKTALNTLTGLATEEPHLPPLYFLLTRWWTMGLPKAIWAIRSFSALVSVLSLGLMYWLGRSLFQSAFTGALAASLMAVSPFHWIYAQEARPYSLWGALILLSSACLLQAWRRQRWQAWGLYTLVTVAMLYTFLYSIWVVLAQGLAIVWLSMGEAQTGQRLKAFFVAVAIAVFGFLPWLITLGQHWQTGLQFAQWQRTAPTGGFGGLMLTWGLHLCRLFVDFEATYPFSWGQLFPYGLLVLASVLLTGYGIYQVCQTAPSSITRFLLPLIVVPMLALILPDMLLGTQQSSATRYFMPTLLGIELAVAYALATQLQREFHAKRGARLGCLLIGGLWILGLVACLTGSLGRTTWGKSGGYIPYVAAAINRTEAPIVISDVDLWIVSLAHELENDTTIAVFNSVQAPPPLPTDYTHYFLYGVPETTAQTLTQAGYRLTHFEGLDQVPIWCLYPDGYSITPCPPQ
ncbi:MAG: glycosyltransferase family 39 protein [Cyanobacteria bacterium J06659_2]